MSYDIPFHGRSSSLVKKLKRPTEAELDPWGATVPGLSLPSTPPTMAERINQFEAQSPYARPRVTSTLSPAEADLYGESINRFVPPSVDPMLVSGEGSRWSVLV